jgi:hypothetical protein
LMETDRAKVVTQQSTDGTPSNCSKNNAMLKCFRR